MKKQMIDLNKDEIKKSAKRIVNELRKDPSIHVININQITQKVKEALEEQNKSFKIK